DDSSTAASGGLEEACNPSRGDREEKAAAMVSTPVCQVCFPMVVVSPRQRSASRLTEGNDPAAAAAYSRLLENFMSPDFDVATFVREMVANAENKGSGSPSGGGSPRRRSQSGGGAVAAVIGQLDQAIFTVDEQLRSKVADCYDQLLLNDTT
ncbi:hypothetical protein FOZ63_014133, partial [Perkinsus olseni]